MELQSLESCEDPMTLTAYHAERTEASDFRTMRDSYE